MLSPTHCTVHSAQRQTDQPYWPHCTLHRERWDLNPRSSAMILRILPVGVEDTSAGPSLGITRQRHPLSNLGVAGNRNSAPPVGHGSRNARRLKPEPVPSHRNATVPTCVSFPCPGTRLRNCRQHPPPDQRHAWLLPKALLRNSSLSRIRHNQGNITTVSTEVAHGHTIKTFFNVFPKRGLDMFSFVQVILTWTPRYRMSIIEMPNKQ